MKKYSVRIHFEGCIDYTVEAENEEQAGEIAEQKFDCENSQVILDSIGDSEICDVEEV